MSGRSLATKEFKPGDKVRFYYHGDDCVAVVDEVYRMGIVGIGLTIIEPEKHKGLWLIRGREELRLYRPRRVSTPAVDIPT